MEGYKLLCGSMWSYLSCACTCHDLRLARILASAPQGLLEIPLGRSVLDMLLGHELYYIIGSRSQAELTSSFPGPQLEVSPV